MQTIIHQQDYTRSFTKKPAHVSLWNRFIQWADGQESNRFGWTAGILAGHGCVTTVVTVVFIMLSGNNFIFWPFAIGAMAACLITNLSAMPTKITIPVFFGSLLIDLLIIALCIGNGISLSGTYL